ncbi:MAG: transcriptional regulator [Kiritimatiellaeota bacterium]|nr:transcriptional regulator [Kiritimatiellota bacterium]
MNKSKTMSHEALERVFHEPNRIAIMSALSLADRKGLAFVELKAAGGLTDGNLNNHLATLREAGAVRITKEFVGAKPRTTVFPTAAGLDRFADYLQALARVLQTARAALPARVRRPTSWAARVVPV